MRRIFFLILMSIHCSSYAQQYDAQWISGYLPTAVIDFRGDTVTSYSLNKNIFSFFTSACICNENGEFLFTTPGPYIADRYGDTLQNGDSLSPCQFTWDNPDGFDMSEGALFLPQTGNSRFYYLFHCSADTLNEGRPGTLYYSLIDKDGNFGLGRVEKKM